MSRLHPLTILCALASIAGFAFAAVSTSDFVAHLDRQVHGIHCSFLPGLSAADSSGASGCMATLMSPYSSILRSSIWGGIPVALPGMAVFSFLGFWCLWLAINGRDREERATAFLFAGSLVPLMTSGLMGYLSLVELDAACKLCIGIYVSSGVLSLASLILWRLAAGQSSTSSAPPREGSPDAAPGRNAPLSWGTLGLAFAAGLTCVGISVGAYAAAAPDFSTYVGACGALPHASASSKALIPYGPQRGKPRMLEVLDPLCPSCKGFEERLSKMAIADEVDRQLLLFPLDESCNWMIDRSIHPGACSISEAVLCSSDPAPVIQWAFENQTAIMAATEKDPKAAANMAKARFPTLASCIGSAEAGAKLNQSLRWAVKNQLQVLTPQVFVDGTRLCGEDTDLGLDFALPRLIEHTKNQPRPESSLVSDEPDEKPSAEQPRKKTIKKDRSSDAEKAPKKSPASDHEATDESPEEPEPEPEPAPAPSPTTTVAPGEPAPQAPAAPAGKSAKPSPPPAAAPAAEEAAQ